MSFNLNDVLANYKDESDFRVIDGVPRNFSVEMVYERRIKGRHSVAGFTMFLKRTMSSSSTVSVQWVSISLDT